MVTHIKARLLIATLSLAVGISVSASLCSSVSAAVVTSSTATVNVSTSCSMTATINTQHTANLVNGQESTAVSSYSSGIGKTTIATICNDISGFAIYTVGYTGETIGTTKSNQLVGANTGITIPTGSGTEISNWGMRVTAAPGVTNSVVATIDNGFDNYREVPLNYTKVAHITSTTYQGAPTQITTTYRAYVSPTQAADSYSGKVRYVLVHPSSAVAATFDSAFASAGKATYKNKAGVDTGYYAMQDMTSAICNGVVDYDTETQLIDTRDEKLYWVSKAQDGKCWMTHNLDLDLDPGVAFNSNNTDLNVYAETGPYSAASGYEYLEEDNQIRWTPNMATYKNNATHENDTATGSITNNTDYNNPRSWSLTVNEKDVYQKGTTFASATCNYFTDTNCVGADKTFNTEPFAENGMHGHLGNYYNWSAAIATNDSSSLTANTHSDITKNPNNSICPKGWRLTRSASDASRNDFSYLRAQYSNSNTYMLYSPLWLVRSGYISNSGSGLNYSGNYVRYWSSTVESASTAYSLGIRSDDFYPHNTSSRSVGFSLRCVAR